MFAGEKLLAPDRMGGYIGRTHQHGWSKELELKSRLEELLGDTITKYEERYVLWDYYTSDYEIELKSRMDNYDEHSHDTWYMPECKTKGLTKDLIIFYHFSSTDSLFYILYDEEKFDEYAVTYNRQGQRTLCIPATDFTKVS